MSTRKTSNEYIEDLKKVNPNIEVLGEYVNGHVAILHRCKICGHEFMKAPSSALNKKAPQGCPKCSKAHSKKLLRKTHEQYLKDILEVNKSLIPLEEYQSAYIKILHKCIECGYEFKISPIHMEQRKVACPQCNPGYRTEQTRQLIREQNPNYLDYKKGKVLIKCPDCNREKWIRPGVYNKFGLRCICNDGISYPNKFIYKFLELLNIDFISEYSPNWAERKKYDIYIPSLNCIIENQGLQHYKDVSKMFKMTLEDTQKNDFYKKQLATQNNIKHYIELNCAKSDLEYLKNSILNNTALMDIIRIPKDFDWKECARFASSSLIKKVADLWNVGLAIKEIYQKLKISQDTATHFLKKSKEAGWCDYSKEEAFKRKGKLYTQNFKGTGAKVQCLETGEIFNSSLKADIKYSKNHKKTGNVSNACKNTALKNNVKAYNLHWISLKDKPAGYLENERNKILDTLPPAITKRVSIHKENKRLNVDINKCDEYLKEGWILGWPSTKEIRAKKFKYQCLEDSNKFSTVKEIANHYNLKLTNLYSAIAYNRSYSGITIIKI